MSSIPNQERRDAADLPKNRDVRRTGGFRRVEAEGNSDAKRVASSIFLPSEFHNGKRTREALLFALRRHHLGKGLSVATSSLKSEAMERWRNEGGQ